MVKKHWKNRGGTKSFTIRLPLKTLEQLIELKAALETSTTQVVIDAIDEKKEKYDEEKKMQSLK
tara:strand:- start:953 stop:1144 length:192 start_codon:yes stop_codon:yes gene_type:complete